MYSSLLLWLFVIKRWQVRHLAKLINFSIDRDPRMSRNPLTLGHEVWNSDSQRKQDCHSWRQKSSTPEDVISLKNLPLFSHFDSEEGLWIVGCGLKSENPREILEHTYYLRALVQSNKCSLIDNGLLRIFSCLTEWAIDLIRWISFSEWRSPVWLRVSTN